MFNFKLNDKSIQRIAPHETFKKKSKIIYTGNIIKCNATRCNKIILGHVWYFFKTSMYFKLIRKGLNNFCLP
jgi:hypothetical protein